MQEADEQLNVTWLGHSTVLVETGGVRLLTDPLLRPQLAHLRRAVPVPREIPREIDAVLLSHVHHDHLDVPSLRLVRAGQLLVPAGAGRFLRRRGFERVVELEAGEETAVGAAKIVATHAEHDARRHPLTASTPSLGYLVSHRASLYFAGDTDLFSGMRDLRANLDLALLPVGGWGPRLGVGHLNPRRAAEALRLLRPRIAVPIHWGTYIRLGLSRDVASLHAPAAEFQSLSRELAPDVDVRILAAGARLEIEPVPGAAESRSAR